MRDEYLTTHTNYLNDPGVNQFIYSRPPFTVNQQREWFKERTEQGDYILAVSARDIVESCEKFVFIGVMDLRDINHAEHTAYSGAVLGDKHRWGKGFAHEAKLMQLKLAFDKLGLKRIYSKTIRPNVRGQHFLENTGYMLIDIFPNARLLDGVRCDEFLYCVSRKLWLPYWNDYYETNKLNTVTNANTNHF